MHRRPTRFSLPTVLAVIAGFSLVTTDTALAQDAPDQPTLAITGGRLIDGYGGRPLADSVVLVAGNRIVAVGPEDQIAVPAGIEVIDAEGMTVMPGLIDLHVHFDIIGHADYEHWFSSYEDRMRSDIIPTAARQMLHAGVTSVRDLGTDISNAFWLREEIASGRMPGPRAFIAGPFLRKTTTSFVSDDFVDTWVVESPADGRRKVRQLAEMGVDLIKTQDEALSFEELEAIYEEAHSLGLPVATHLFSQKALRTALEAGLGPKDTVEHVGEGRQPAYPEDIVQMIVENDVYMAPTIIAEEGIRQIWLNPEFVDHPDWRRYMPADLYADIVGSYDNVSQHPLFARAVAGREGKLAKLRQLYEAGAEFVVASDSGTRGNPHFAAAWREMFFLVQEVGLDEMEVILTATARAASVLRRNDLGRIAEGKLADLIVVDGDPLMNIAALKDVVHVVKDGAVFR